MCLTSFINPFLIDIISCSYIDVVRLKISKITFNFCLRSSELYSFNMRRSVLRITSHPLYFWRRKYGWRHQDRLRSPMFGYRAACSVYHISFSYKNISLSILQVYQRTFNPWSPERHIHHFIYHFYDSYRHTFHHIKACVPNPNYV